MRNTGWCPGESLRPSWKLAMTKRQLFAHVGPIGSPIDRSGSGRRFCNRCLVNEDRRDQRNGRTNRALDRNSGVVIHSTWTGC